MPKQEKRALIICAHDDDEVIGAGGTVKRLTNDGVRVTTVVFATGNEGYATIEEKDRIVERRRAERMVAQKILGTSECIAHEFHDYDNLDRESVYKKIIQAVRSTRPHIIFTHLAAEYLAHRTLSRVAPEAVWQAGWRCSLELGDPWKVDRIYHFSILDFIAKPSHVVDISDTLLDKLKAMEAYESQHTVVAGILDQIEARARAYGSLAGVRYGEAFLRSNYIPIIVEDPGSLML
jgi:LmbE family N-acetylglucosaminyl deacetylase